MLGISRASRPIGYRRVSRTNEYEYKKFYAFLDQVVRWDYSLKIKEKDNPIGKIFIGETNFGTCVAASFAVGPGWINVLPSLGTTSEVDENYVLQHFLQFRTDSPPPAWCQEFVVPEQAEIEARIAEARRAQETIQAQIVASEQELAHSKRWLRLLYAQGSSLEEIVKEALEQLRVTVQKTSKEKDDYRVEIGSYPMGVIEVKGTHNTKVNVGALRQLANWMDEAVAEKGEHVKGIFVGNAREKKPA